MTHPPAERRPDDHGPAAAWLPPEHPQATLSLVLGIVGIVACGLAAPFAWHVGRRTLAEIDASGGRLGGRGAAQAGYVLGIVGTVLIGVALVVLLLLVLGLVVLGISAASVSP
jgi:uncharacterized membrane protein YjgN (DUF898 family)